MEPQDHLTIAAANTHMHTQLQAFGSTATVCFIRDLLAIIGKLRVELESLQVANAALLVAVEGRQTRINELEGKSCEF